MPKFTKKMKEENLTFPKGVFNTSYLASLLNSKSTYRDINKLISNNKITRIGRGQYVAIAKNKYEYQPTDECIKISKYIINQFPELDFRIGETFQINWFANHQISKNVIIIETEKLLMESLFYSLRKEYQVLLKPNLKDMARYSQYGTVIIQNLVSEAPKTKSNHNFPLEKLLIDIVCDKIYLSFIEKGELQEIYKNAFASYSINLDAMLRYATRRSCKEEIVKLTEFLQNDS